MVGASTLAARAAFSRGKAAAAIEASVSAASCFFRRACRSDRRVWATAASGPASAGARPTCPIASAAASPPAANRPTPIIRRRMSSSCSSSLQRSCALDGPGYSYEP